MLTAVIYSCHTLGMSVALEELAPHEQEQLELIGLQIATHRKKANLDQVELAEKAGVSLSTVRAVEGGRNVTLRLLLRVATALNVHITAQWPALTAMEQTS